MEAILKFNKTTPAHAHINRVAQEDDSIKKALELLARCSVEGNLPELQTGNASNTKRRNTLLETALKRGSTELSPAPAEPSDTKGEVYLRLGLELTLTAYFVTTKLGSRKVLILLDGGYSKSIVLAALLAELDPSCYATSEKMKVCGILVYGWHVKLQGHTELTFHLAVILSARN